MRCNDGTKTKKITLIVPEATEVIDIVYYWRTQYGMTLKTATILTDDNCIDGTEAICYKFPDEEDME